MTYHILPVPCARWARALAAASPDDLSLAEREALAAHVTGCPACSTVQREYRAMDERIFNLPRVAPLAHLPAPLHSLMEQPDPDDGLAVYFVEGEEFISVQRPLPVTAYPFPQRTEPDRRRLYTFALSVLILSLLTLGTLSVLPLRGFSQKDVSQTASNGQMATAKAYRYTWSNLALYNTTPMGQIFSTMPTDGQINWTTSVPRSTGAIAVSNQAIYVGMLHAIVALRLRDQMQLWSSPIDATVNTSLQADKSGVYVGSSQGIYALQPDNGSQRWHFVQPGCPDCDGTVVTLAAGNVYSFSKGLYALDTATGKVIWHDNRFLSATSQMVQANGKLYVTSTVTNQLYILRADTGQQLNALAGTSVIAADGFVYVSTQKNGIYALRTSDDSVLWNRSTLNMTALAAGNGLVYGIMPQVITDGPSTPTTATGGTPTSSLNFFGHQESGIFYQVQASDGSINWKNASPLLLESEVQPLVIDGNLYMSTMGGLTALNVKDGSVLWQNVADQVVSNLVAV